MKYIYLKRIFSVEIIGIDIISTVVTHESSNILLILLRQRISFGPKYVVNNEQLLRYFNSLREEKNEKMCIDLHIIYIYIPDINMVISWRISE